MSLGNLFGLLGEDEKVSTETTNKATNENSLTAGQSTGVQSQTGGTSSAATGATNTANQQQAQSYSLSGVPEWLQDAAKNNYNFASNIAAKPYTPYTGERVAGLTDDQQRAADMIRSIP